MNSIGHRSQSDQVEQLKVKDKELPLRGGTEQNDMQTRHLEFASAGPHGRKAHTQCSCGPFSLDAAGTEEQLEGLCDLSRGVITVTNCTLIRKSRNMTFGHADRDYSWMIVIKYGYPLLKPLCKTLYTYTRSYHNIPHKQYCCFAF